MVLAMGIIGDLENHGSAVTGGRTAESGQPQHAPAPSAAGAAATWNNPPDAGGGGQITVHRDVLRSIGDRMRGDVAELDAAVQRVRNAGSSLGSLSGWSTGNAFGGNVLSSCTGFGQLGAHASDTHNNAAKALMDAAATYEDAETASSQAAKRVLHALGATAGSLSAAHGS